MDWKKLENSIPVLQLTTDRTTEVELFVVGIQK
jgi:hypothetical protein